MNPSAPRRGDNRLVDLFAERCDLVVYVQAWDVDAPADQSSRANALIHARVFLNGREIDRAVGAKMIATNDFMTVDVRVSPTSFNVIALNKEDWEKLSNVEGATL